MLVMLSCVAADAAEAAYAAMHIPLQRYNEQTNTKTYKHAIQTTLVAE